MAAVAPSSERRLRVELPQDVLHQLDITAQILERRPKKQVVEAALRAYFAARAARDYGPMPREP